MKIKTSITLSADILACVRRARLSGESRSRTIERLLRERSLGPPADVADKREVAQINRHAVALNAEAADVLDYQRNI